MLIFHLHQALEIHNKNKTVKIEDLLHHLIITVSLKRKSVAVFLKQNKRGSTQSHCRLESRKQEFGILPAVGCPTRGSLPVEEVPQPWAGGCLVILEAPFVLAEFSSMDLRGPFLY